VTVERGGARIRLPLLGTVTPGHEPLCPLLARQVHAMWPGPLELFYALPAGRTAPYDRTLPTDATTWTGVLLAGVRAVKQMTGSSHLFILLEDHVPLWPCDDERLGQLEELAVTEDLSCLFFTKFDWPWRGSEITTVGRHRLARLPRDFRFYNQCQPAIWKIDDYIAVLAAAVKAGVEDPWAFERFSVPDQREHYVSDYKWPSRHCGYRRGGKVYLRALYTMKVPEGKPLRDALLAERFPRLPRLVRAGFGSALGLLGRLRGLPQGLDQRHSENTLPA
jgi:hypothetical protein